MREILESAIDALSGIEFDTDHESRAILSALSGAIYILKDINARVKYNYGDFPGKEVISIVKLNLEHAALHLDELVPIALQRKEPVRDVVADLISLGIDARISSDGKLWTEEWVIPAYISYIKHNGFAGLSLRKYLYRMLPPKEPMAPKKRIFSKQRIDNEDTVDDEIKYNVKRKARDKAPRLKRRMGHI